MTLRPPVTPVLARESASGMRAVHRVPYLFFKSILFSFVFFSPPPSRLFLLGASTIKVAAVRHGGWTYSKNSFGARPPDILNTRNRNRGDIFCCLPGGWMRSRSPFLLSVILSPTTRIPGKRTVQQHNRGKPAPAILTCRLGRGVCVLGPVRFQRPLCPYPPRLPSTCSFVDGLP